MYTVTDQFHHALRIIACRTDNARRTMIVCTHGIIQMCDMMYPEFHGMTRCLIICIGMRNGNCHFVFHFPDQFFCTFHFRCNIHKTDLSARLCQHLTDKSGIRLSDIAFFLGSLFIRRDKRAFHIDPCKYCFLCMCRTVLFCHLTVLRCRFCNLQKSFLRNCHGRRADGRYSLRCFISCKIPDCLCISIAEILIIAAMHMDIRKPRDHITSCSINDFLLILRIFLICKK